MRYRLAALLMLLGLFSSGCLGLGSEFGMASNTAKGEFRQVLLRFDEIGGYEDIRQRSDGYKILSIVCEAYFRLNDYERAETCYERLLRLTPTNISSSFGKPNYHDLLGLITAHRALMKIDLGDYDAALRLSDEALIYLEQGATQQREYLQHISTPIFAMRVAGIAHALTGQRDRAEEFAQRIDEWGFDIKGMAGMLGIPFEMKEAQFEIQRDARATIYFALRDYEQVVRILEKKRKKGFGEKLNRFGDAITTAGISELLGPSLRSFTSRWENFQSIPRAYMHARALYEIGELDKARLIYDHLLEPGAAKNFGGIYYAALADRARIARADGDNALAIDLFERAIGEIERQRSTINSEAGKIGFAGDKQATYADLVAVLIASDRPDDAFGYAERAKSRALVDLLASKRSFGAEGSTRRKNSDQVLVEISIVDQDAVRGISLSDFEAAKTRGLSVSRPEHAAVIKKARVIDAQLASVVTVGAPAAPALRQLIADSETILEFFGHDTQLFLFVVERGRTRAVVIETDGLDAAITRFRSAVERPSDRSYTREARWLYNRLIGPVAGMIEGERVTIVPHGALHYLPFAALDDGHGPLLDRYAIRLLPSLSVAEFLTQESQAPQPIMALGNPDKGDARLDLVHAGLEAKNIARAIPGSTLLLRGQATETALIQNGHRYRWLHLASHGEFNSQDPLASRLLLAADSLNDGDLTLSEVFDMDLDADLVTLSACETALGELANGDEVLGFTRGFLFAGARSVVSSLWKVDDRATSTLMESFYANMRTLDRRQALREAQRELRASGKSHPYYWAAFQLTGATGTNSPSSRKR